MRITKLPRHTKNVILLSPVLHGSGPTGLTAYLALSQTLCGAQAGSSGTGSHPGGGGDCQKCRRIPGRRCYRRPDQPTIAAVAVAPAAAAVDDVASSSLSTRHVCRQLQSGHENGDAGGGGGGAPPSIVAAAAPSVVAAAAAAAAAAAVARAAIVDAREGQDVFVEEGGVIGVGMIVVIVGTDVTNIYLWRARGRRQFAAKHHKTPQISGIGNKSSLDKIFGGAKKTRPPFCGPKLGATAPFPP